MLETTKKIKLESTSRTWIAKPVLAPELTEDPRYFDVYVGILKDKKTISKAIQSISLLLPGFHHLKRCSNQRILICSCREDLSKIDKEFYVRENCNLSPDDVKSFLVKRGFDLELIEDKLEIISVPLKSPKTKIQAAIASKAWPVNFHPDVRLESILCGKEFDDTQLDLMEKCMRVTIEAAKRESVGNENCTGSAMIVDPENGNILALAAAKVNLHPMYHASMLAIDLVAKLQGGGVWKLTNESTILSECNNDKLEKKRKFSESLPLCYPASMSSDITFPELEPFKGKKTQTVDNDTLNSKEGPYLCTGYWIFLLQEPCPLCAMALLHSRIGKIFYGRANVSSGVLGSKTVLHSLPGLNHRYQVWRGILESECTQMAENIS